MLYLLLSAICAALVTWAVNTRKENHIDMEHMIMILGRLDVRISLLENHHRMMRKTHSNKF